MKILIIGWSQFPTGDASSSRIRTLAKGLIENGGSVHFITTAKIDIPYDNDSRIMSWEGVSYESSYPFINENNLLNNYNIIKHIYSLWKSWKIVQSRIEKCECDIIYFYGWSFIANYTLKKKALRYKIPFFFDICEWYRPQHFSNWFINPLYYDDWFGRKLPDNKCSGIIAITSFIEKKYIKQGVPVIIIPAIYDFLQNRFKVRTVNEDVINTNNFSILYAGFCKPGDGLDLLIDAVRILKTKGVPIRLSIIGTDASSGVALSHKLICQQDKILCDIVDFKGKIPHDDYQMMLASVDVLVLTRKKTLINLAAFPTRLPEYLSTGLPVLTSFVPDVNLYLEPDEHAKLIVPDSVNAIVEGLFDLWNNPSKAKSIGIAGQLRGAEVFDYRPYVSKLYELFVNAQTKIKSI
jgi:glycosyltransferase involved in cell wall biosynthesis